MRFSLRLPSFLRRRHSAAPGSEGTGLDAMHSRLLLATVVFASVYVVIAGRLVWFGLTPDRPSVAYLTAQDSVSAARPDILDRNGEVLATDIRTASLFADPRKIIDVDEAVEALSSVLPELDTEATRRKLASGTAFQWLKREIPPSVRDQIHALGIPGIDFVTENKRFYPGGPLAAHIMGSVNIDNQGIAGIEKHIDDDGLADLQALGFANSRDLEPVRLSIDARVQHVVRDEVIRGVEAFGAVAGVGIVMDVETGEILAMSSIPDFDPNDPAKALEKDNMNRATAGVFELGSVFKTFSTAMALDSGKVHLTDSFDARVPLRFGGRTITDFHGKHRVLSVPEIFIFSSNLGTARMALSVGIEPEKDFLERIGMFKRVPMELPESAAPIVPRHWPQVTAVTVSFGHSISVTPMHATVAAGALMNGGMLIPPTFYPRTHEEAMKLATRVVAPETSDKMRYLFRLNVEKGSGRRAEAPGYRVGGKTGTAEKVVNGKYSGNKNLNSFLAAFPMDKPRYVVMAVIDEPDPVRAGGRTAGTTATTVVSGIVRRIAPMLGVQPKFPPDLSTQIMAEASARTHAQ